MEMTTFLVVYITLLGAILFVTAAWIISKIFGAAKRAEVENLRQEIERRLRMEQEYQRRIVRDQMDRAREVQSRPEDLHPSQIPLVPVLLPNTAQIERVTKLLRASWQEIDRVEQDAWGNPRTASSHQVPDLQD